MSVLSVIQLILLAGLSFVAIWGCAASCCAPLILSGTASWSPERRHRALLLLSIAPLVFAAAGVLAVLMPSLLGSFWPEFDHCLGHDDHHVHLCLVHLPRHLGNAPSWLVLMLGSGWISVKASMTVAELYRASKCAERLRMHGRGDADLGASILPTTAPLCLLVGVLKPTLFLSQGLLGGVGREQIAVILHHERAHAARRDILVRLVARAGALFMLPRQRARVLDALELAAEQSCDEVAASSVGDRLQVAEAILKVERLLQPMTSGMASLAASFCGVTVPERVSALLRAPRRSGNVLILGLGFALMLCGVLAASGPLHHATESLLETLVH
jgi:Zn-dependent protease with chaperone function